MDIENEIEIGSILGGYRIEKVLGRGGMGVVYKGHELTLNRKVAIKVLSHQLGSNKEFIERFKREARAIAALNHPNIVNILSYGETGGLYYFAMEYIKGRDLGQILKEKQRLPIEEALSIVTQVAGALSDAGSKGIVHRDLKPSNIMVDEMRRVKVTDFGVAHFHGTESRLTQTGFFLGTPEYASPEQVMGRGIDIRSDIYALGAVLYNMLSGSPPFTGPSPMAVVVKIATEPVAPIRQLHPELPDAVCDLIDKMMASNPRDRFQTPMELVEAVAQCMEMLKADASQIRRSGFLSGMETVSKRKSRGGLWVGYAVAAVVIIGGAWLAGSGFFEKKTESPQSVGKQVETPPQPMAPQAAMAPQPVAQQVETPQAAVPVTPVEQIPQPTGSSAEIKADIPKSEPADATAQVERPQAVPPTVIPQEETSAVPRKEAAVSAQKEGATQKPTKAMPSMPPEETVEAPQPRKPDPPLVQEKPAPKQTAQTEQRRQAAKQKAASVRQAPPPDPAETAGHMSQPAKPVETPSPPPPAPAQPAEGPFPISGQISSVAFGIINPFGNRRAEIVVQDASGNQHTIRVGRATIYTPHRTPAVGDNVTIMCDKKNDVLVGLNVNYK